MRKAFLLTGLMLSCMSPAVALEPGSPMLPGSPMVYGPPGPSLPQRRDRAFTLLRSEIIDLRHQAIALKASDGGTLTTEHRDGIQARIDAAYQRYYATRAYRQAGLP
jgi:hypothetical protein